MDDIAIGDRVHCIVDHPDNNETIVCGSEGTVITVDVQGGHRDFGVEWDDWINGGHSLNGSISSRKGWYVKRSEIELIEDIPLDDGDSEAIDSFLSEFLCRDK